MTSVPSNSVLGFDCWGIHEDADRRFRKILRNVLLVTGLVLIGLPFLKVDPLSEIAKQNPQEFYLEILPPAAIEKPKPAPPKVEVKKVDNKPVSKAKEKASTLAKAEDTAAEKKAAQRNIAAAKKAASASGVMAFSEQLATLRETNAITLVSPQVLRDRGSVVSRTESSTSNLLSVTTHGSGGAITSGEDVSDKGKKVELAAHNTQKIAVLIAGSQSGVAAAGVSGSGGGPKTRSLEEIQLAFDRSKSAFYAIFNRAARSDSTIGAGTVVVSLTIQPDGTVSECSVVSSSFFNPELKEKLIQRVKQIKFESKGVPVFSYDSYPISYVPR